MLVACLMVTYACNDTDINNQAAMDELKQAQAQLMASIETQKSTINELRLEKERLWAVTEIQNLMGTYSMWVTSGFCHRVPELFTATDDTVIEMVWGRYTGKDAAYRAYAVDHRGFDTGTIAALGLDVPDIDNTDAFPPGEAPPEAAPPGGKDDIRPVIFVMHLLTTPVIQVAKDVQTARGVWTSPGIAGANWGWMKYGCDFKLEDGKWKIWHLHVYGLFVAGYDKGWGVLEYEDPPTEASRSADKPPTTGWEYYKDATYIPLEPAPPEPYDTWDESKIVPGTFGEHELH